MDQLNGRTAVVTGAGSGMGKHMALDFAREGMNLVLADVDQRAIEAVAALAQEHGAETLCVTTDVSVEADVAALAEQTYARFAAAHVLCNNAGVVGTLGTPLSKITSDVWRWVLSINVMGVVHGVQCFLPRMLEQQQPAHIVNTASMAGLSAGAGGGAYCASKHAVVSISRSLRAEMADSPIGVSVLCPGLVNTALVETTRARAREQALDGAPGVDRESMDRLGEAVAAGMDPADIATMVVSAIRADRFYIVTHPQSEARLREVYQDVFDDAAANRKAFFPDWSMSS